MLVLAGVLGDGVGPVGAVLDALAPEAVGVGDRAFFSIALTARALKRPG